jgi:hypothetical protein
MVIISKAKVYTDGTKDKVKSSQPKSNQINAEAKRMNLQLFPASVMATIIGFVYIIVAAIILAFIG